MEHLINRPSEPQNSPGSFSSSVGQPSAVSDLGNVSVEWIKGLVSLFVVVVAGWNRGERESDQLGRVQRSARFVADARFGCHDDPGLRGQKRRWILHYPLKIRGW
ncbi:hypothetical protein K0M31_008398 [Melipona bicolor]|uniref:Uncharacterized protein n=1 Tax=Melipona bicolor TaxID=60889 RepID=A0AA40KKE8_9HYME|nr:hypothetical protein K0M31_008398 [Melipona bicolor]